VVCWFAGLFYIVRLFVYHVEANERPLAEADVLKKQFVIMERRLWKGITIPSMVITTLMGAHLVTVIGAWSLPWFHIKALALVVLFWYSHRCGRIRKELEAGTCKMNAKQLRGFNEIATVLLFLIVFAAVLKSPMDILYGMLGFIVVASILFFCFRKRLAGKSVSS
jgi:putative membrane protein